MENKIKYVDEVMWENSTNMWIKLLYGIIKICKWGYHREKNKYVVQVMRGSNTKTCM